MSTYSE